MVYTYKSKLGIGIFAFVLLLPLIVFYAVNGNSFDSRSNAGLSYTLSDQLMPSDLNGDRQITVSDFTIWIEAYRDFTNNGVYMEAADLNGDKKISVSDFISWLGCYQNYKGGNGTVAVSTSTDDGFASVAEYAGKNKWKYTISGVLPKSCYDVVTKPTSSGNQILLTTTLENNCTANESFTVDEPYTYDGTVEGSTDATFSYVLLRNEERVITQDNFVLTINYNNDGTWSYKVTGQYTSQTDVSTVASAVNGKIVVTTTTKDIGKLTDANGLALLNYNFSGKVTSSYDSEVSFAVVNKASKIISQTSGSLTMTAKYMWNGTWSYMVIGTAYGTDPTTTASVSNGIVYVKTVNGNPFDGCLTNEDGATMCYDPAMRRYSYYGVVTAGENASFVFAFNTRTLTRTVTQNDYTVVATYNWDGTWTWTVYKKCKQARYSATTTAVVESGNIIFTTIEVDNSEVMDCVDGVIDCFSICEIYNDYGTIKAGENATLTYIVNRTKTGHIIDDCLKDGTCAITYKPILYLYPESTTDVIVKVEREDALLTTYPKYNNGWNVTAKPNGDLYDSNGKYYYALYWDETRLNNVSFDTGFYVTKDNAIDFLEEKLSIIGLTDRERNEFIMYWLPKLEDNEQSLVYFELTDERESYNKLYITPAPDSLLRVHIHIMPVDRYINIPEQELPTFNRTGFVAVEWGGTVY